MNESGVHPALEYVITALHDVLDEDDLDAFRPAVDALLKSHDLGDIAAAALKLAYENAPGRAPRVVLAAAPTPGHRDDRPRRDHRDGPTDPNVTQIYVNVGRMDRVRPGDLVGAITGETNLEGHDIGAINIFEKFSLVEVPDAAVEDIIEGMRDATIRGRQAQIRRDRGPKR